VQERKYDSREGNSNTKSGNGAIAFYDRKGEFNMSVRIYLNLVSFKKRMCWSHLLQFLLVIYII